MHHCCSYTSATEEGSMMHNGFINVLIPLASRQVTFQNKTDTSVPSEDVSVCNDDKFKATTRSRKASIASLGDLKFVYNKLIVAFGICCILILFLSPIVLYYTEGSSNRNSSITGIGNINVSQVTRISYEGAILFVV